MPLSRGVLGHLGDQILLYLTKTVPSALVAELSLCQLLDLYFSSSILLFHPSLGGLLHFQFALYRFAAVGLHSGWWSLHAWKHKWGTGKENFSYLRGKKNASSLTTGPAGKLGIADLFCKTLKYWEEKERVGNFVVIPPCLRDRESGDISKWFPWDRDKVVCALTIKA